MSTYYINTDLVIRTPARSPALEDELNRLCDPMYAESSGGGGGYLSVAAPDSSDLLQPGRSPESHISSLLDALDALSEASQEALRTAVELEFDVGWQSAAEGPKGARPVVGDLGPPRSTRGGARRDDLPVIGRRLGGVSDPASYVAPRQAARFMKRPG
ncbi:MAG: hypothetical protein R3F05_19330 [Planctomycetota bacterium]